MGRARDRVNLDHLHPFGLGKGSANHQLRNLSVDQVEENPEHTPQAHVLQAYAMKVVQLLWLHAIDHFSIDSVVAAAQVLVVYPIYH